MGVRLREGGAVRRCWRTDQHIIVFIGLMTIRNIEQWQPHPFNLFDLVFMDLWQIILRCFFCSRTLKQIYEQLTPGRMWKPTLTVRRVFVWRLPHSCSSIVQTAQCINAVKQSASASSAVDWSVYRLCTSAVHCVVTGPRKLNFPQDNNWHGVLYLMSTDLCAPLIIDFYFAESLLRRGGLHCFFFRETVSIT